MMTPSSTPKRNSSYLDSSKSGSGWRFSSLHENPVKGWREGADPRGHRHRLIGCATTHPLGNALVGARIAHLHTLSDYSCLRCHVSQPSRNKPGPKRFDDRDCDREGRVALSTRSRVVIKSKMSFECLLDTDDARTHFMYIVKHLRVSSAAPVVAVAALNRSYETRLDVQIRCDIDSTDYLPLSRASQHSDTLICNRTSGLVGSCAYSACNKSASKSAAGSNLGEVRVYRV